MSCRHRGNLARPGRFTVRSRAGEPAGRCARWCRRSRPASGLAVMHQRKYRVKRLADMFEHAHRDDAVEGFRDVAIIHQPRKSTRFSSPSAAAPEPGRIFSCSSRERHFCRPPARRNRAPIITSSTHAAPAAADVEDLLCRVREEVVRAICALLRPPGLPRGSCRGGRNRRRNICLSLSRNRS